MRGILIILVIGVPIFFGIVALLAPWNFYYGGHFHASASWQGIGTLHSDAAGGDYTMWIRLSPTIPGYRKSPLRGVAYLCTPHGERFSLTLGGLMPRNHGTDLTGVPLHLYMNNHHLFWSLNGDDRPNLNLYGSFGDSVLNMEDRGGLAHAFGPDGKLLPRQGASRPSKAENIKVTFKESSSWTLGRPACP
jgi:hypothetical protein